MLFVSLIIISMRMLQITQWHWVNFPTINPTVLIRSKFQTNHWSIIPMLLIIRIFFTPFERNACCGISSGRVNRNRLVHMQSQYIAIKKWIKEIERSRNEVIRPFDVCTHGFHRHRRFQMPIKLRVSIFQVFD